MADPISRFYDELADDYHLVFEDWDRSIRRQADALEAIVRARTPDATRILDCTCGIGTQALGLALKRFEVVGSDLSPRAVARASREARLRDLPVRFFVSDVRRVAARDEAFDVVVSLDNSLPHLDSEDELRGAVREMARVCRAGGQVLGGLREYRAAIEDRPALDPPRLWGEEGRRRLTFQIWTWRDERRYDMVHVIATEEDGRWRFETREASYRAVLPGELAGLFAEAGLEDVEVIEPSRGGYYQPLVVGGRR